MNNDLKNILHICVNDVIESFKWVYENKPESIFDEPMLDALYKWHEKYGIEVDLYVFELTKGFDLSMLQSKYWDQLRNEKNWLKLGWHRRHAGEITDDQETEFGSIERVYNLVSEQLGEDAWSSTLRLHRWTASDSIIKRLKKTGVTTILTTDKDLGTGFGFDDSYEKEIERNRIINRDNMFFRKTDIRLDALDNERSVEELICKSREILYATSYVDKLEVFFHEWIFSQIKNGIDSYLQSARETKYPIMINVCDLDDNGNLIFVGSNMNGIYRSNPKTGETNLLGIPMLKTESKFSACYYRGGDLWMMPFMEREVYLFDKLKMLYRIKLPYELLETDYNRSSFMKGAILGNKAWIIPRITPAVFCLDLSERVFTTYDVWPEGVSFSDDRKRSFYNSYKYENYLYLFSDGCSHDIRINMENGSFEKLEKIGRYGFVDKNGIHACPDDKSWRACGVGDKVILSAAGEKQLYCFEGGDIKEMELNDENEKKPKKTGWFRANDVIEYNDNYYVISNKGNVILILDANGRYVDQMVTEIPFFDRKILKKSFDDIDMIKETKEYMLSDYLYFYQKQLDTRNLELPVRRNHI